MFAKLILKLFNLPVALRVRFSPAINRLLFRCRGVKFGREMTVLGFPYMTIRGSLTIGDYFYMSNGDGINPISSNLRGLFFIAPGASISIGNHVGMSSTRMRISNSLTIGNNVNIGACVLLIDTDSHQLDYHMRRHDASQNFSEAELKDAIHTAPIVIEDDVWLGANVTVLKGVTIGARSIIGAGSLVTRSIPADCIAAGNPAKVIKHLSNKMSSIDER